jgi:hypothetical protein
VGSFLWQESPQVQFVYPEDVVRLVPADSEVLRVVENGVDEAELIN